MAKRGENGASNEATDGATDAARGLTEKISDVAGGNGVPKKVLIPATIAAVTAAAGYAAVRAAPKVRSAAVSKAEDAAEGAVGEAERRGGVTGMAAKLVKQGGEGGGKVSGLAGAVTSKLGGGGKEPSAGWGKGRRNPIQRWVDVAVPVQTAYNQWTQFEEFPKFMHRVVSVKHDEEERQKLQWEEKIWFSRRQWEAEITEQIPDERIAWRTVSGTSHVGHVTFHRLDDELTRVMVSIDFNPSGMMEKMASGLRFVKRAAESDLARFKAFIETHGEETGAWRGRIEDSEVVRDVKPKEGKPIDADKERHTPENVGKDKKPKRKSGDDSESDEGEGEGEGDEGTQRRTSERRPPEGTGRERRERQERRQQRRQGASSR